LQEAGTAVLQQNNLQLLESKEVTINGLNVLSIVADSKPDPQQQQQQQPLRTLSYLIQYGNVIYHFLGVSATSTFNNYAGFFTNTMQSFKVLTDQAKINKLPERVRVKTVAGNSTLEQVLRSYNVPEKRMEEMAILNGMARTAPLTKGTLIKIIAN